MRTDGGQQDREAEVGHLGQSLDLGSLPPVLRVVRGSGEVRLIFFIGQMTSEHFLLNN